MVLPVRRSVLLLATSLAALMWQAVVCAAPVRPDEVKDRTEALPKRLENVNVREQLGKQIPEDASFTDSSGKSVRLGDYFDGTHPVILTFNYSDCPMLCSLQLNKLVAGLRQIQKSVGPDFRIVTISIDPKETFERARETKERFLSAYGRQGAATGWHFLTGPEAVTRRVADAAGFSYTYNEARKEWLHAAVLTILTPKGKVARYLYGIDYSPETLKLSVVEASAGKIASTIDRLILYCFHYDEAEGRYAPVAMNIMRVGAGLVAVVLGAFLAMYWLAEARKKRNAALSSPVTVT